MKHGVECLIIGTCLTLLMGCSATDESNTFTLTADMPPGFAYVATAAYVPLAGQNCKLDRVDDLHASFNPEWREDYKPYSKIEIRRTRKRCEMVLDSISLSIKATYGKNWGDFSGAPGYIAVRQYLDPQDAGTFNEAGESEFFGHCHWEFSTVGPTRYITKLLGCKQADAHGNTTKSRPFAAYTRDQLPGKTVKLTITLPEKEQPAFWDQWLEVPGGWKRCLGKGMEDHIGSCRGNYTDFSTVEMVDGRICTIYPGCTEDKEDVP